MALPSIKPRNNRGVILFGLGAGLLVGTGLTLAMLFWPLSIPAALVFVFSISPLFAWAKAYSSMVAITAVSVVMGGLATTAAKVLVTLGQGVSWGVRSILNLVMSPKKEIVSETGVATSENPHHDYRVSKVADVEHHDSLFTNNSSHEVHLRKDESETAPRDRSKSFPV
jgi:hypothetical protein